MKLAFVRVCGFRGFRKPVRFDFSDSFTVIEGRNGVGKSSIFDAVEFAVTGTISKYLDAKSDGESVDDYLWWAGEGERPLERFVEVGFRDDDMEFSVRRTPTTKSGADTDLLRLIDHDSAPRSAITQLCTSTIIRDELIARLSLDMKETERFELLRDAIGATDADEWIDRAKQLESAASTRLKAATAEVEDAGHNLAEAARQLDEARMSQPSASLIGEVAARLQRRLSSSAPLDELPDITRRRLAKISEEKDDLVPLADQFERIERLRETIPDLDETVNTTGQKVERARLVLEERAAATAGSSQSESLSEQAKQLEALVTLGREIGLREGQCPLCESEISHEEFEHGLESALGIARQLDTHAVEQAEKERAHQSATAEFAAAEDSYQAAVLERDKRKNEVREFDERLAEFSLANATKADIERRLETLGLTRHELTEDLRLIDTISLDRAIERASSAQSAAEEAVTKAEERLGRARLAATRAKTILNATRRAAAETLDQRLDRVLPLMSELYKRLRPHPIWKDIEYSVRGDVRRFLKLQVGDDINPQFVFSSGQRRATGLAFLLSVNLSLTWSRWRSILLDDPVQHVDDYRTVNLSEVLSHLCNSGRQVICAVEDSALADLMCRRLPTSERTPGKRIALGNDADGALSIKNENDILPLRPRTLVPTEDSLSA